MEPFERLRRSKGQPLYKQWSFLSCFCSISFSSFSCFELSSVPTINLHFIFSSILPSHFAQNLVRNLACVREHSFRVLIRWVVLWRHFLFSSHAQGSVHKKAKITSKAWRELLITPGEIAPLWHSWQGKLLQKFSRVTRMISTCTWSMTCHTILRK